MSKIICELCGTAYPDTSTHCPICGSVYSGEVSSITTEKTDSNEKGTYTHVKGGRFSKANVSKRNRTNQPEAPVKTPQSSQPTRRPPAKKKKSGFAVFVIILMLLLLAVVLYLTFKFFWPVSSSVNATEPTQNNVPAVTDDTSVPCTELTLDVSEFVLSEQGSARMIYISLSPANTTDVVSYNTSDPTVATVNEYGKVEAVGPGQAVITITCGDMQKTCSVLCDFQVETMDVSVATEPTEVTTEPTEEPTEEFRLNRADITFSSKGERWKLYSGDIDVSKITWSSDNESVAQITNGTVTAVGSGTTTVHGEYNGMKVSCIIRCAFSNSGYEGVGGHGGVGEDG